MPDLVSVREAFYAIQGEGARAGQPTVFLRLAGCNLDCPWCDTDWQHGDKLDVSAVSHLLHLVAAPHRPRWVTITGGEPCVAPAFDALVVALQDSGYCVSVETNGTRWRPTLAGCHVVVSPKARWQGVRAALDADLARLNGSRGDYPREFKLVVDGATTLEDVRAELAACPFNPTHRYLQPLYDSRAAWDNAYRLVLADPQFSLSLQLHKWIGCR